MLRINISIVGFGETGHHKLKWPEYAV